MSNQLNVFWDLTGNDRHIPDSTNKRNLETLWQQKSSRGFVSYGQLVAYYFGKQTRSRPTKLSLILARDFHFSKYMCPPGLHWLIAFVCPGIELRMSILQSLFYQCAFVRISMSVVIRDFQPLYFLHFLYFLSVNCPDYIHPNCTVSSPVLHESTLTFQKSHWISSCSIRVKVHTLWWWKL